MIYSDDFNDNSINEDFISFEDSSFGTGFEASENEEDQQMVLKIKNGNIDFFLGDSSDDNILIDISDNSFHFEMPDFPDMSDYASYDLYLFGYLYDSINYSEFSIGIYYNDWDTPNKVKIFGSFYNYNDETGESLFEIDFDEVNHKWLRYRESSGTMYIDASPDGNTWTNLGSLLLSTISDFDPETVTPGFYVYSYIQTLITYKFDNFNTKGINKTPDVQII